MEKMRQIRQRLALLAVLFAGCLLASACSLDIVPGSGTRITESRPVSGVERVSLTCSGDVILTQGDEESLTVETDDNLMEYITTHVSDGTLTLGTKVGYSPMPTRLVFTLTVQDLDGLTATGSGDIDAARFDADRLEVKTTGSGSIRVEALSAEEIEVRVTGSGDVELAGQVDEQTVTLTGSGKYRAGDLRSSSATVKTTGSGGATLWVTESLNARITGSGSIEYYGSPRASTSDTGSGRVKQLRGR
jgi:hypothetical protein